MGKQYLAVNEIRHGESDGSVKVFTPGQAVAGLSKETMVALWNAGVLTEFDPDAAPKDHRDDEIAALKAQIEALQAEKEAEPAQPEQPSEGENPEGGETDPDQNP